MKAAIDIGTNTVLLLVADVISGQLKPVHEEQRIPRLGRGVDADRIINEEATRRVSEALREYKVILENDFSDVEDVIVTATSAVRDARNREEFMASIKEETGFEIRLLSGREEAEWTAAGALSVLDIPSDSETLILDIGGGSTEIAYLNNGEVVDGHSYDMGSVRFTERFLKSDPPSKVEIERCREEIQRFYGDRLFDIVNDPVAVGVAGTVTTLAAITQDLRSYQPEKLAGFTLKRSHIEEVIHEFATRGSQEMLERYPVYLRGRADIFMAGMLILEGFLDQFELNSLTVSTGGIRHGALLKLH
ncbi:MAG TPA: Ppx/GppA family phosphatase [Balneolaceae bacterium]|nr:Ppx/GppA family phosphatase [Balneolaceae bacterium]